MFTIKGFTYNMWLLALTVSCGVLVNAAHWSYEQQNTWPEKCIHGKHQSPINLQKDRANHRGFTDFQFKHYDTKYKASITNNGHSVALKLLDAHPRPSVRGGGLLHEYVIDHLHFHWESEHTIQNNRYPLELHLVHYANIFNSTSAALDYENGLAVIGILFDLSEEDNPTFEPLLTKLTEVRNRLNTPVELEEAISVGSFLPKDVETFFRYEGSLTTPGCDEVVTWTVLYHVNHISKKQFSYFPTIQTHQGLLKSNYRDLQKLNNREVFFRSLSGATSINSAAFRVCLISALMCYLQKKML